MSCLFTRLPCPRSWLHAGLPPVRFPSVGFIGAVAGRAGGRGSRKSRATRAPLRPRRPRWGPAQRTGLVSSERVPSSSAAEVNGFRLRRPRKFAGLERRRRARRLSQGALPLNTSSFKKCGHPGASGCRATRKSSPMSEKSSRAFALIPRGPARSEKSRRSRSRRPAISPESDEGSIIH